MNPVKGGNPPKDKRFRSCIYLFLFFINQTVWFCLLFTGSIKANIRSVYIKMYSNLISSLHISVSIIHPVWLIEEYVIRVEIRSSFMEPAAPIISLDNIKK